MDRTLLFMIILTGMVLLLVPYITDLIMMKMNKKPSIFDIIKRVLQNETLVNRLSHTRLSRMLPYVGINMDDYLMDVPIIDVKRHVANCGKCKNTAVCDQFLQDREPVDDMSFCPNNTSLVLYNRVIHAEE